MRRHVHWIILLIAVPVSYVVLMFAVQALMAAAAEEPGSARIWLGLAGIVALLAAVVVPIVLLIRAIIQMRRTFRRAQRSKGRYTKAEQQQLAAATDAAGWWEHARRVRGQLLAKEVPAAQQQWDVVPYPDERFFAALPITYARYYGTDVTYGQSSTVAIGHPAFVIGAFAVTAIANANARSRAATLAAAQWREWQQTMVYVTNRRLVVHAAGQWLSFDYDAVSAVYPDVGANALVCQFDRAEPMLLSGPAAPVAAIFTVLRTHGVDGVRDHPGLQPLDQPAAAPTLAPIGRRV